MAQTLNLTKLAMYNKAFLETRLEELNILKSKYQNDNIELRIQIRQLGHKITEINDELDLINKSINKINSDPDFE